MSARLMAYGKDMLTLFAVFLLSSFAANLVSPVWPIYIKSLGASMVELGYIFAVSNGITAVLPIVSGSLSDRYGRKKLNVIGAFLGVFPPLFYSLATRWADLIPWVVLTSVASGLYIPIRWSLVADYSTARTRASAYSWMNIAFLLGSTVAPLIGGLIADILDIRTPFLFCFTLMSLCVIFSLMLHEPSGEFVRQPFQTRDRSRDKISGFLSVVITFSLMNVIQAICIGMFTPITPIFVKNRFLVDYAEVGLLYAVGFGLASMFAQIPGGKLAQKYSRRNLIIVTVIFSAPFFGLFALSRSFLESILLMFLSNLILNLSWPAYQDLMMALTPPLRWGLMNGVSAASFWAGMMVGSAVSGIIWETFGMFFPYFVSATLMLLSVIPMIFLKEPSSKADI